MATKKQHTWETVLKDLEDVCIQATEYVEYIKRRDWKIVRQIDVIGILHHLGIKLNRFKEGFEEVRKKTK